MAKTASRRACLSLAAALLLLTAARARAAGEVDLSFDAGSVTFAFGTADVRAVHVLPDGKILIGGAFSQVQGTARHGVARLLADGTLDTTFVPPFSVGSDIPIVRAFARQPDGKILVGVPQREQRLGHRRQVVLDLLRETRAVGVLRGRETRSRLLGRLGPRG